MAFLTFWGSRRTSIPPTRARPSSALRRPSRISTVVVLPAPLGPSNPRISRSLTRKEMPSTATRLPYRLRSPSTTIAKPSVCVARPESPGRAITLMPQPIIAAAPVEPQISDRGRRHRLLHDDDRLARLEAELPVDREHAGVVGAVIGVHDRNPVLRCPAGHQHLQHPRDPPTSMAAQHAGIPDLGITIRAAQEVAQADDVIAVAGHEEALEQNRRPLEDAAYQSVEGRVLPVDVRLVGHVAPDRRLATIELLAGLFTIDLRKRDRLDAIVSQPASQLVESAEIDRRWTLARGLVALQLRKAALPQQRQRCGELPLQGFRFQPSNAGGRRETVHVGGQPRAQPLPPIRRRHRDEALGTIGER